MILHLKIFQMANNSCSLKKI